MSYKFDFGNFTDLSVIIANGKALINAIETADSNKPLDTEINIAVSSLSIAATLVTAEAKNNPALIPKAEIINTLSASTSAAAAIHNFHNGDIKNGISNTAAAIASSASVASLAAAKAGGKAGGRASILADTVAIGGNVISVITANVTGSAVEKFLMDNAKAQLYSELIGEGFTDEEIEAFGIFADDRVKNNPPQENIVIDSDTLYPNIKNSPSSELIKNEVIILGQDGKIREQTIYSHDNNIAKGGKIRKQDIVIIGKDGSIREETIHILEAPSGDGSTGSGSSTGANDNSTAGGSGANSGTSGEGGTGANGNGGEGGSGANRSSDGGNAGSPGASSSGGSGIGGTVGSAIGGAVGGRIGGPVAVALSAA